MLQYNVEVQTRYVLCTLFSVVSQVLGETVVCNTLHTMHNINKCKPSFLNSTV